MSSSDGATATASFSEAVVRMGRVSRIATDANCGRNVFIEPRLVRPGLPHERGKFEATLAVFASVADSDADTGKPFTATVPVRRP